MIKEIINNKVNYNLASIKNLKRRQKETQEKIKNYEETTGNKLKKIKELNEEIYEYAEAIQRTKEIENKAGKKLFYYEIEDLKHKIFINEGKIKALTDDKETILYKYNVKDLKEINDRLKEFETTNNLLNDLLK